MVHFVDDPMGWQWGGVSMRKGGFMDRRMDYGALDVQDRGGESDGSKVRSWRTGPRCSHSGTVGALICRD